MKFAEMEIVLVNRNDIVVTSFEEEELGCLPGDFGMNI